MLLIRVKGKIPKSIYEQLAFAFAPGIKAFYKTKEGQEEYEKWKKNKDEKAKNDKKTKKVS